MSEEVETIQEEHNFNSVVVDGQNIYLHQVYDPLKKMFTHWEVFCDGVKQERVNTLVLNISPAGSKLYIVKHV